MTLSKDFDSLLDDPFTRDEFLACDGLVWRFFVAIAVVVVVTSDFDSGSRGMRFGLLFPPLATLNSGPPDRLFQFYALTPFTTRTEIMCRNDCARLRRILVAGAGVYTRMRLVRVGVGVGGGDGCLPGIKEQGRGKGE